MCLIVYLGLSDILTALRCHTNTDADRYLQVIRFLSLTCKKLQDSIQGSQRLLAPQTQPIHNRVNIRFNPDQSAPNPPPHTDLPRPNPSSKILHTQYAHPLSSAFPQSTAALVHPSPCPRSSTNTFHNPSKRQHTTRPPTETRTRRISPCVRPTHERVYTFRYASGRTVRSDLP